MTNDKSISILNDVLETLLDSRDGYQKAAEVADRDVFKQFFTRRAAARNSMVTKTQAEIRHLGGEPAEEGTILAKAHRMFLSISSALEGNDEAAVEAVEDGEEYLRNKMKDALANDELAATAKTLLSGFNGELRADGRLIDHLEASV
ncbi:ferritin-like domain-containing protein [Parasphingorhabdus flavimaris]|jgi:uncharacterized protein (TIGR02284 family)|uniref:PA2169 family four-helix-bundle protein n=1 Tax=Parasphingorhabdus flavimaris TaxID=266812 RepID=A0ABX2MXX4_9SPHN|nr:PA2169 family four-helix-bundle protein [Parasphingorhabdus flavimaris]NVD26297.1 PA2169 family four-helix-bundle protein [Parasphingorhabdus flavimaris]|tara:strand:- start:4345 stop:4785 length:441 start_codon:yes stop_codon:yes gene_type:complete